MQILAGLEPRGKAQPAAPAQPYAEQHHSRYGLSPDGATVLAVLPLGPGMMCSRIGGCQVTGPPVEGPLVVAHDLATGVVLWTLRATADVPGNRRVPVISPNGQARARRASQPRSVSWTWPTAGCCKLLQLATTPASAFSSRAVARSSNSPITFWSSRWGRRHPRNRLNP